MDPIEVLSALLTAAPQEEADVLPAIAWVTDEPPVRHEPEEADAFDAMLWASIMLV